MSWIDLLPADVLNAFQRICDAAYPQNAARRIAEEDPARAELYREFALEVERRNEEMGK